MITTVKVISYIVSVYTIWLVILFLMQRSMIYPTHFIPTPQSFSLSPEIGEYVVVKNSESRDVHGWFLKAKHTKGKKRPTVVFFHGNAELAEMNIDLMSYYTQAGYNVLLPEFRGYGRVYGSPSQKAIVSDMVYFLEWLSHREEVDSSKLIYHGRSLGGGVACALSKLNPPRVLILESTFLSVAEMAKRYLAPPFMILDKYPNDETVSALNSKILILHGRFDEVIPFSHGRRLAEISKNGLFIPQERSHNISMSGEDWAKVLKFVESSL